MLQLATGAGKTAIFSTILHGCYQKDKRAIMVVRGRSLCQQASQRLTAMGVPHGVFMASHKLYDESKSIQVVSIDTATSRKKFPEAEYVIIDEAHYAVSDSFKSFLEQYKDARWLSVTATPWSRDGLDHLASDVVYPISIKQLTDQGYLVPARYFVPSNFDASKIELANGEFKDNSSIDFMTERKIHGDIVENYLKRCLNEKTFLFAVNVNHAQMIGDMFNARGIKNCIVTAETPIDQRTKLVESFDLVISISTLTTGFDYPPLKNIILARPTMSKNLYIQMLGRGTRTYPGKDFFTIYDHVGNVQRHGFIEDEEKADLAPQKKNVSKTGNAPVKICDSCLAACHAAVTKCPECGEEFKKKPQELLLKGKGELKELTREQKDKNKFILKCSRILARAWSEGKQQGWMYHQIKDNPDFKNYRKDFYHFYNMYETWEKAGKDDSGQAFGWKVRHNPYSGYAARSSWFD